MKKHRAKILQAKKQKRATNDAIRRKRYLKVKHILNLLYRDQITELAAYTLIKELGVEPTTTAWDWEDLVKHLEESND